MLEFTYKGANAVIISTKKSTLVTDPKTSVAGLKDVHVKETVELITEDRFGLQPGDEKITINMPGEYEVSDYTIRGIPAQRHLDADGEAATIYRIVANDIAIGLIGNIAPKLSEDQQEALGILDVLIVPVGGNGYTLDATEAAKMVRQLEPKIVIPIHYADSGVKYEVPQDELDRFTSELSLEAQLEEKLKLKNASSLPAGLTIIALQRT